MNLKGQQAFPDKVPTYHETLEDKMFPTHVTTSDPTTGDDEDDGYVIGHRWFRTDTLDVWIATDVSSGAAVWVCLTRISINSEATTSHTIDIDDINAILECSNAGAITVTFPQDSDEDIPIGKTGLIRTTGGGTVTCTAGTGASLESEGSLLDTNGDDALIGWIKTAANTFLIIGNRA